MVFFTCTTATGTSSLGASPFAGTGFSTARVLRATEVRSSSERLSSSRWSRSADATAMSLPSTVCVNLVRDRRDLVAVAVEHPAKTVAQQLAEALVAVEPARQGSVGLLAGSVAHRTAALDGDALDVVAYADQRAVPGEGREPRQRRGARQARRALALERVGLARDRQHRLGGRERVEILDDTAHLAQAVARNATR